MACGLCSIDVLTCPATRGQALSVANIEIIFETTKKKDEKFWIRLGYPNDIARI